MRNVVQQTHCCRSVRLEGTRIENSGQSLVRLRFVALHHGPHAQSWSPASDVAGSLVSARRVRRRIRFCRLGHSGRRGSKRDRHDDEPTELLAVNHGSSLLRPSGGDVQYILLVFVFGPSDVVERRDETSRDNHCNECQRTRHVPGDRRLTHCKPRNHHAPTINPVTDSRLDSDSFAGGR
jgi:hypothetical protein